MCDRAPVGMEYTLHSTGRNGYLTVVRSRALMCAICTAGLRVAFLTNKDALTMVILYSFIPAAISANEGLLRTRRNLTSTPLIRNLSCRNISTWRRPIMSRLHDVRVEVEGVEPLRQVHHIVGLDVEGVRRVGMAGVDGEDGR